MAEEEGKKTSTPSDDGTSKSEPDGLKALEGRLSNLESDLQEAIKRRDSATKRAREAEAALEEAKHSKAKDSNDIEALESSYKAKLETWEQKYSKLSDQFNRAVIDREVEREAAEILTSPELFLQVHRENFTAEVDEESNKVRVRVKNSADSIKDLVRQFGEKHPGLKRSLLKPGMGSTKAGDSSAPKYTREQLANMSSDERRKVLREDKELRRQLLG
jgi:DNA repair exonuclease SbcCD ATPase subunit